MGTTDNRTQPNTQPVDEPSSIDPRRARAVELWAEGKTNTQVAAALGVSRESAWRWRQEPEVAAALSRFHSESRSAASARLLCALPTALDVLVSVMSDITAPAGTRIRAAAEVLSRVDLTMPVETVASARPIIRILYPCGTAVHDCKDEEGGHVAAKAAS